MTAFPSYVDVDYEFGTTQSPSDYPTIGDKLEQAADVVTQGLETYRNPVVMWTGGKDSTLVLSIIRTVAREHGYEVPPVIFIDHFQHFDTLVTFVERWADEWDLELIIARNDTVGDLASEPGDEIRVADLDAHNRRHVREILQYDDDTFPFLLDTYVGNHLLKTVPLNDAIESVDADGIFSGVRWDEQAARSDESFFSARHDESTYPPHDRIHPILQFTEADVWQLFWRTIVPDEVPAYPDKGYVPAGVDDLPDGVDLEDVPVAPKYFDGYRSLGSEVSTERSGSEPAWQQDLEHTTERAGRAQDKEDLMERLRDLGYM